MAKISALTDRVDLIDARVAAVECKFEAKIDLLEGQLEKQLQQSFAYDALLRGGGLRNNQTKRNKHP